MKDAVIVNGLINVPKIELDEAERKLAAAEARIAELTAAKAKDRPRVVCLCGSTRFWREFQAAGLRETMAGRIVLSIGAASGTDDKHFGNLPREEYDRVKTMLDELHKRKIDLSDEVLILNVGGYIGESTRSELEYAKAHGKDVRYLETTKPEKPKPIELLPCPFCGTSPVEDAGAVYCRGRICGCGAWFPSIEQWNRRAARAPTLGDTGCHTLLCRRALEGIP